MCLTDLVGCISLYLSISRSHNRKKSIPMKSPATAGNTEGVPTIPRFSDISIEGMSRLHTDAATMTPAEKPCIPRRSFAPAFLPVKNTRAAPMDVPIKGIIIPQNIFCSIFFTPFRVLAIIDVMKRSACVTRISGKNKSKILY